jgi:hypothetical protein
MLVASTVLLPESAVDTQDANTTGNLFGKFKIHKIENVHVGM